MPNNKVIKSLEEEEEEEESYKYYVALEANEVMVIKMNKMKKE